MRINFEKNKFLVTGGAGFLGSSVVEKLIERGVSKENLRITRSSSCDLRYWDNCMKAVHGVDVVIHLAAKVGGIGFNQKYPAELFYDNAIMGLQIMEASRRSGVKKFVGVGTVCGYPINAKVPFKETDFWDGYPEQTNAPYGIAKKFLLVQGQSYKKQYGFRNIYLIPVNLYGPRDHFDPEDSHVIPSLIKKFFDAKIHGKKRVVVWGSGTPTREFLYVDDAAEAIILATKVFEKDEPVNLGSGQEIGIKDLAELIKEKIGYEGELVWDASRPDGQPRRVLDTSKAKKEFGFESRMCFDEGLTKTINWYRENMV
jgi:GDP-L-fucose synthase